MKFFKKLFDFIFEDNITYFAASLSFFTIFSILPILALLISIVSYFNDFNQYREIFIEYISNLINPIYADKFLEFFNKFLINIKGLGIIGFIYMIFVFTMFFRDYEYIISQIFQVPKKNFIKSAGVYILFTIFIPILFIIYMFVISFYSNILFVNIITFLFSWILIFILFKIASSDTIHTKAALITSFITFIILNITKHLFIYYVIYNKTYQTLYGSISILLFFFLWIYISWIIYLHGIKACYLLNKKFKRINK